MSRQSLAAHRRTTKGLLFSIGFALIGAGIFFSMIVPFVSSFSTKRAQFYHAKTDGALTTRWGGSCCEENYALYPDGSELATVMIENGAGNFWNIASPLRLKLETPFYKKTGDSVCQVVFTRESLLLSFDKSCVSVEPEDSISRAFAAGHKQLVDYAHQTKSAYDHYKSFNLVN